MTIIKKEITEAEWIVFDLADVSLVCIGVPTMNLGGTLVPLGAYESAKRYAKQKNYVKDSLMGECYFDGKTCKDTYYADFEVPTVKQITIYSRYGEKTIILENCKKCPLRDEDFDECCATCERLPTSRDRIPDHCDLEDYNG